jgi:pimeloyl-ACP methyl ester carboxylesterase
MKKRSKYALLCGGLLLAGGTALPIVRNTEHEVLTAEVRARAPGQFARLSQGYTHYEVGGPEGGPTVVLVHGFSVPFYVWDPTFKALAESGFRVIRYDLYGHGLSDRPDVAYGRDLFVGQLAELLDSLEVTGPVDVAGVSMGGAITAAFAAEHPERVARVVLVDPLFQTVGIGPLSLPGVGEYLASAFYVPSTANGQGRVFVHPERFPDFPGLFREQMRYKGYTRALLSTARTFIQRDPMPDYVKLKEEQKPTLLIWAAQDRTLGTAGAEILRKLLEPEFLWVEDAGHTPHYERPEIVSPRIIEFLRAGAPLE